MTQQFDPNVLRQIAGGVTQSVGPIMGGTTNPDGTPTDPNNPGQYGDKNTRWTAPDGTIWGKNVYTGQWERVQQVRGGYRIGVGLPFMNNGEGYDLKSIMGGAKPPDVPAPDLSFLSQDGGGGGGGGAGTDFYQWLADQRAREGNPQLQRTSIDWTGYGSGQGPEPAQPTPTPYSAYGAGGGGAPPPPATPGQAPPAGASGALRGMGLPVDAAPPANAPPGGGGTTGSIAGGGLPFGATPTGQPPQVPPPTSGGGVRPKALPGQPEQPAPPPTSGIAYGGPRALSPTSGAQPVSAQAGSTSINTPANQSSISQGGPGVGPKFPEVKATGNAIPAKGQFANPVFQQQQQTRNEQTGLLSRLKSDMEGGAPSLAQILLRKGTDENIAAANAIAASGGPGSAAVAGRQAALGAARANQDLVGQVGALRAQEYTQARQEATGLANTLRVNDLMSTGMSYDNAIKQAQLEADQNKTQYQGNVQMVGIRAGQEQGILDLGMRGQALNSEQQMHLADLLMQKYGIDKGAATAAAQRPGMLDYIMKGAATGGAVGGPWGAVIGAVGGAGYGAYGGR